MLAKLLIGFLTVMLMVSLLRRMAGLVAQSRMRVAAKSRRPQASQRLRQDPRTGVYFPDA